MAEKTEEELLKEIEEIVMDEYCSDILTILWKKREMRFNEIHRALQARGIKLSKPTLSEHLKHLQKGKWIRRKAKGVQNVSYFLHECIKRPSESEALKQLEEVWDSIGAISSKPSPEMTADLNLYGVLIDKLREVLLRIEIEPQIGGKALNFGNSGSRLSENRIVLRSRTNERYRRQIIQKSKELHKLLVKWNNERASNE